MFVFCFQGLSLLEFGLRNFVLCISLSLKDKNYLMPMHGVMISKKLHYSILVSRNENSCIPSEPSFL